jgi:hypothetical protein
MKETREFENGEIIDTIKELEFLRVNLARIGRLETRNSQEVDRFLLIIGLFIFQGDAYKKLTKIWRVLVSNYSADEEEELDELVSENENWNIPYGLSNEQLLERLKKILENTGVEESET